jgi:hypothetical protein
MAIVALATTGYLAWAHVYWPVRALVFVPAYLAAVGLLQATRNTCVARAKEGTFEHDDMSKSAAPDDDAAASRAVARRITRDSTLVGLAGAALALLTALVR